MTNYLAAVVLAIGVILELLGGFNLLTGFFGPNTTTLWLFLPGAVLAIIGSIFLDWDGA
ncbi:MAG TPA: hypothetical protein VGG32_10245 [Thermoplasmata archaeon]|jgi:hypothetical protein